MKRPRIAALVSIYRKHAHAQHIVDRFLEGYGWNGRHHRPEMDVISMYVDQVGEDDVSHERAARHPGLTLYPTIAECLTLGGSDLAVDGVLIVFAHAVVWVASADASPAATGLPYQPQANTSIDASDGPDGHLPQAEDI